MKLTAMTYNIFSGKNLAKELNINFAASVIRQVQPDFVTLNEVRSHTADVGDVNQAWELGRLCGYYPVFARAIDVLGGEYGNAFLSRLPVLEQEIIHIPDPETHMEGGAHYEHRCVLRCVLAAGDRPITVLSTHFGLNPDEQENAVRTVLELAAKDENPTMLMGDLNLTPESPILSPLYEVFTDAAVRAPELLTFPSDTPDRKIDYILCGSAFRILSLRSMNTQCSDHRPLIAELSIG